MAAHIGNGDEQMTYEPREKSNKPKVIFIVGMIIIFGMIAFMIQTHFYNLEQKENFLSEPLNPTHSIELIESCDPFTDCTKVCIDANDPTIMYELEECESNGGEFVFLTGARAEVKP